MSAQVDSGSQEPTFEVNVDNIKNLNLNVEHAPTKSHPLERKWTLWYTKPLAPGEHVADWSSLISDLLTIETVEEFWGMFNNIPKATSLAPKSDYHLFRSGVRPEWEDPSNSHGGRWSYQGTLVKASNLDVMWRDLLLAAIGEMLDLESKDEIMGVVCNIRQRFFRLSIWTRSSLDGATLLKIGQQMKTILEIGPRETIEFTMHDETLKLGSSSRTKAKLTL